MSDPSESLEFTSVAPSSFSGDDYHATTDSVASAAELPIRTGVAKRINKNQITADIIADRIIDFCGKHGDWVTNLRLQKLLYYVQAWHLALHDRPLFQERFEAWIRGPVQPEVYARYIRFGIAPIDQPQSNWQLPKRVDSHIDDVMDAYGSFSSFDLERLACDEQPWRNARMGVAPDEPSTEIIDMETMKTFYRARSDDKA